MDTRDIDISRTYFYNSLKGRYVRVVSSLPNNLTKVIVWWINHYIYFQINSGFTLDFVNE